MKKYIEELEKMCNESIDIYPFLKSEDIKIINVLNDKELLIKYETGEEIVFDKNLYDWLISTNPMIKEDQILYVNKINDYDLLITYKNGNKIIYDTFDNTIRGLYKNNNLTEEEEKLSFKYRLQRLMNRKFITQEELAERIGTSQTMITRYVTGRCIPSAIMLKKIAKVLECSMDDFFYKHF